MHLKIGAKSLQNVGGAAILRRMVHSAYLGGGGGLHANQIFQHVAACCAQVKHGSELALGVVEVMEEGEKGEEGMGACSRNTGLEMLPHPLSWCCIQLMTCCSRYRAAGCLFLDHSECGSADSGVTVANYRCSKGTKAQMLTAVKAVVEG